MMKLAAPLLALALFPLAASAEERAPANGYLTEIVLTYRGEIVYGGTERVGEFLSTPSRVGKTVGYVKSVSWDAAKRETTTVRGELQTGTSVALAARPGADGSLLVDVRLDVTKLEEMKRFAVEDQAVELPNVLGMKMDETIKVAKSEDGWDYRAPLKQDGFVLSLKLRTGNRI